MLRFAAVAFLAILGCLFFMFSDKDRFEQVSATISAAFSGDSGLDQDRFQTAALADINRVRSHLNRSDLKVDPELRRALFHIANSQQKPARIDLDTLFTILRDVFPGTQFLSATVVLDTRADGLLDDLRNWSDAASDDYEAVATFLFKDGIQLGCLAILTRRLPSFDLAIANRDGGRFYNECPRCTKTHAIELGKNSQTLILSCPDCDRPYDVLAIDVSGRFRRAPDFLTGGFQLPPDGSPKPSDPRGRLRQIWTRVLDHCAYEFDSKGQNRGEVWKTPAQTWNDRAGDCEDTAILLADILISTGFDARVAVGWNVHIGQHAWTVVRIGREQFVLESTLRREPGDALPNLVTVREAASEYQPEQLFDRKRLYFRQMGSTPADPCLDYWRAFEWAGNDQLADAE